MVLLDHVVIPVASADDATVTCAALTPYLDSIDRVTAVHVIEKGGGTIDKAPMEKRKADAAEFLAIVDEHLGDEVVVETRTVFNTNVVTGIFDAATDANATAIAFHPRGGSRIIRLLSGDTANCLVTDPVVPVIALPDPDVDTDGTTDNESDGDTEEA